MTRTWLAPLAAALLGLPPAHAAPDLTVTDIELLDTSPDPEDGTVRATIQNIGPDDVDLPFMELINLTFHRDAVECDTATLSDTEMGSGETAHVESTACNPTSAARHEITVAVDTDSDVSESNEANNSRTESFPWGTLFFDDFESGDTLKWSSAVPSA